MSRVLVLAIVSAFFGCGDDATSTSSSTSSGATTSSTSEGSTSAITSSSSSSGGTGGSGGASTTGGGTPGGGGQGGGMPACDGDGDGALKQSFGCCGDPDPCDCDDTDSNVFPGQTAFFDTPRPFIMDPQLMWDFNCDGAATKQYPAATGPCGVLACGGTTTEFLGDNGDYVCGAPGTLVICMGLGLQCQAQGGVALGCQ